MKNAYPLTDNMKSDFFTDSNYFSKKLKNAVMNVKPMTTI